MQTMDGTALVFRQNLRLMRKARKWTQSEMAERANISDTYYGEIERGDSWPSQTVMDQLCQALKVRPWRLFFDENVDENPNPWLSKHGETLQSQARSLVEMTEEIRRYVTEIGSLKAANKHLEAENHHLNANVKRLDRLLLESDRMLREEFERRAQELEDRLNADIARAQASSSSSSGTKRKAGG